MDHFPCLALYNYKQLLSTPNHVHQIKKIKNYESRKADHHAGSRWVFEKIRTEKEN